MQHIAEAKRPRSGASAGSLLLTVLGEFARPIGRPLWTRALVEALAILAVDQGAARQAIARSAAAGTILAQRSGRQMRWRLSAAGKRILEAGAARIYGFGGPMRDWDGTWLVLFASIPESERALRHRLRSRLAWAGFGSAGQGVWISPRADREDEAREILRELGPKAGPQRFSLRARFGAIGDELELVRQAWNIDELETAYMAFTQKFSALRPKSERALFGAQTQLVHDWRRFPFIDPGLPASMLPANWAGTRAKELFDDLHARWSARAQDWFAALSARE